MISAIDSCLEQKMRRSQRENIYINYNISCTGVYGNVPDRLFFSNLANSFESTVWYIHFYTVPDSINYV